MKNKLLAVCAGGVSLLILAAVVFAVSALLFNNALAREADMAASASGGVSGNIMVWLDNDDYAAAMIAGFNREYPAVTVSYQNVGNVDARGKVSLDGPAGIGPDVFLMPHDQMGNAIIDDICLPFSQEDAGRYSSFLLESSLKTCTFDGALYGVPIATENIALFYNRDLLGGSPVPSSFE